MRRGSSEGATVLITLTVVLVIVLIGLITFGISAELHKARQLAGLADPDTFNPDSLPAPAAGPLQRRSGGSLGCDGILFSAADHGKRFVRESGGGLYYAAEVDGQFEIFTLSYGHLLKIEKSGLDTHTYRKLKHALYHCDGLMTESGLYIAQALPENPHLL